MAPHTRGPFFGIWLVSAFSLLKHIRAFKMGCMNLELRVGHQKIRFDRDATVALYRDYIKTAGADSCTCASCRNFALQRGSAYPKQFLLLLNELGADPTKEWEVFDYDFESSPGHHQYGGWFLFSGEIIEGATFRRGAKPSSYWFTTSFPDPGVPRDVKVCAVEFCVEIFWDPPKS